MSRSIKNIFVIFMLLLVFIGCGGVNNASSDEIPPQITIIGDKLLVQVVGSSYEDLGAHAVDDVDGDISAKIETEGSLDTNKEGRYIITYSVSDAGGNKAIVKRTVEVIEPLSEDSWGNFRENGTVELQDEQNIKILSLDSNDSKESGFVYKEAIDPTNKYMRWVFKTKENFSLRMVVETNQGDRTLVYNQKDTGSGKSSYISSYGTTHYIGHGLGSSFVDGEWHSSMRDIEGDLKRYEPTLELVAIKEIYFYGFSTQFAAMKLYTTEEDGNIDNPVVVSAPGVVLTFDDSYVDSWNDFMPVFQQKGVVATFFCHRWSTNNNITEQEEALLKIFEDSGHEVGYHTKDHLGTRDAKYDAMSTKELKAKAYFDDQIIPGVKDMIQRGFNPKSFSYPYISGQPVHNTLIRETLPHIREFFAHVMLMDDNVQGSKSLDEIKVLLDKLKEEKEIGVLLGHWIAQASQPSNISHQVPEEKLKAIIDYAKQIGLTFYTLEEAHKIYINQ